VKLLRVVCKGGMYVLQLMDHYSAGFGVLVIAVVECVAVSWIYGRTNMRKYLCKPAHLSINSVTREFVKANY